MPCNTIKTASVQFSLQHTRTPLLKKAMESLGYQQVANTQVYRDQYGNEVAFTGTEIVQKYRYNRQLNVDEVKQAYSREIIRYARRKMWWEQQEETPLKGRVKKRY